MSIILFIIILGILVFVHEFGHFISAKFFGVRVDEFAIGFPPRIFSKKIGETDYALNLIPIGGYVKIYGEDPTEDDKTTGPNTSSGKKMSDIGRPKQALILLSGILGNFIFAWVVLCIGFMFGLPTGDSDIFANEIKDRKLIITNVIAGSPASIAGILPGDNIVSLKRDGIFLNEPNGEDAKDFISKTSVGKEIELDLLRKSQIVKIKVETKEGLISGKPAVGIAMEYGGIMKLPPHKAVVAGTLATWSMTKVTAIGIFNLIKDAILGQASMSSVTGPVGIANMIGDAQSVGFMSVLILTVLISINLAVINLVPFPALDGGRLLFVLIESIIRKPLSAKFSMYTNQIGFLVLLILMAVITYKDIVKLIIK
jgi:regulator of sigma E protease